MATSTIQFSRNIGGTLGVSILGVILSSRLSTLSDKSRSKREKVILNSLINSLPETGTAINVALQQALGTSMANMFIASFIASILVPSLYFSPRKVDKEQQQKRRYYKNKKIFGNNKGL